MSAKVDRGLNIANSSCNGEAIHYYLFKTKNTKYVWTESNLKELIRDLDRTWDFVGGEDEHLIEGAALVAPLSILFWEKE